MKLTLLLSKILLVLPVVDATTRVAVIELGKAGTVQNTDSPDPLTTVAGVTSFWSALHSPGRRLQYAGMALVPDLFNRADNGVVLGLKGTGVDLDLMPFTHSLLSDEGGRPVGHLEVNGNKVRALLDKVPGSEIVDSSDLVPSCKSHAKSPGLTGVMTLVGNSEGAIADAQLRDLITGLDEEATTAGKTIVLHLVVEEEEDAARRRVLSRRLEGEDEEEGEGEKQEENQNENQDVNGNNGNPQQNNGFYGYGYYNSYGEWVTPYKTMFQIQYFNVVLWTSIGLTVILFFTVFLMLNMPLMPDTLLFGESAKLVGDD